MNTKCFENHRLFWLPYEIKRLDFDAYGIEMLKVVSFICVSCGNIIKVSDMENEK